MSSETTSAIATAMSAATSGPATPDSMTISKPPRDALLAILVMAWSAILVTFSVLAILAWGVVSGKWPAPPMAGVVTALLWIALTSQFCVAVLTVALASSRLGKVDASAGVLKVNIDGTAT